MPEIVQEIGAYAGLASVVGLAVLSALYFSQARDVKRLREWAGRAPERADAQAPAVPGRMPGQPVAPPAQTRPGAPSVPGAAPAAASTGARPVAAPVPGAMPGAATPAARPGQPLPAASAAATKPGRAVPVPAAASAGTAAPAKPGGPGQNAGAQNASPPPAPPQGAPAQQGAPVANSVSPAAGAQKAAAPSPGGAPPAGPATPAGQRPPAAPPVPPAARTAPPAAPGGSGGPTRPPGQPTAVIPPPRKQPWYRHLLANPLYAVLAVAGVLILGGAAAFGVTQLASEGEGGPSGADQRAGGGSGEDAQAGNGEDRAGNEGAKVRKGGAVKPGNVTVAVLNGTTVPGLAATLADQVTAAGFKAGTIANFGPNQQLAESVVQYASGHEREAAAVSRKLGIGQRETATAESRELAGDATVIVIAGGDKAP